MGDMVIINADLSSAELRVMALLSDDPWMIAALQPGAGNFFDILLDGQHGEGWAAKLKLTEPERYKEERTKIKSVVYGLSFGRQPPAIAKALGIPTREAQQMIDSLLNNAKNFAKWREDVQEAAVTPSKRDMLITPFGRKFQSEVVTGRNYQNIQREALSFLPQSTSSDICLLTAVRIDETLESQGYRIFNIVHDAIMVEGPRDGAEEIGKYVVKELGATGAAVFGDKLPFLAEYSVGTHWGEID